MPWATGAPQHVLISTSTVCRTVACGTVQYNTYLAKKRSRALRDSLAAPHTVGEKGALDSVLTTRGLAKAPEGKGGGTGGGEAWLPNGGGVGLMVGPVGGCR